MLIRTLVEIARWLTGGLFIFSGLIKMNDPVGFAFKLEEYFSKPVLDLEFLMPLALPLAIVLVIFEVLLGFLLLLGIFKKFTLWSLLGMIVFFTFLTFYSAWFNKVTDCGCFGDAIKLTPWESFWKDVVLLVLIVFLFRYQKYIKPRLPFNWSLAAMGLSLIACIALVVQVLNHLPVMDFRPYKIGVHIPSDMEVPEDAPAPVYEYAWVFSVSGEEQVHKTMGSYPEVEGELVEVETTLVEAGYEPPIHDFTMEQEGTDYTEQIMAMPKVLLIVARELEKSHAEGMKALAPVISEGRSKGYEIVVLSASSSEASDLLPEGVQANELYFGDLTTLKTIVRSNPGILVLEAGKITQKVHYNDVETLRF